MRVLLTGGGTAGHINPALAIAETVLQNAPDSEIAFVGVRGGKEEDLVPREGYPLHYVKAKGFSRKRLSLSNIPAYWLALTSPYSPKTVGILKDFRPDIVIGTGGYACWPIMAAAVRMGIPTAVHESNALPGLAIRKLQDKVDRIWINFEKTAERLHQKERVIHVGNPLRRGFGTISREEARKRLGISSDIKFILSFGGSLGAERVNEAVLGMMKEYSSKDPLVLHLHATGKRDFENVQSQYRALGLHEHVQCRLADYIYDMPLQMAAADLIISRAGAMTVSELALMKKSCILIPSPNVADNHQYLNAKALADRSAAVLLEESALDGRALSDAVRRILEDPGVSGQMETAIAAFARQDVNRLIWQDICMLTGKYNGKKERTSSYESAATKSKR